MTSLSIVIATYNRSQSLLRALTSFIGQSAPTDQLEIIVVNNNSSDDTEQRVLEFAEQHPGLPLQMVCETRQGLSYARNCGIEASSAPYIAIIDDDETVNPDFVRAYIDFFDSHPDAVAAGGRIVPAYEADPPKWISPYAERPIANPLDLGESVRPFPKDRCPGGGNMGVRRSAIERYGAFDPALGRVGQKLIGGEETDFFERLSRSGEPFYYIPQAIIYHHIPPQKLTHDYFVRLCRMVGVSARIRSRQTERYSAALAAEAVKWAATLVLALLYTAKLQPAKAHYLLIMRRQITAGLLGRTQE